MGRRLKIPEVEQMMAARPGASLEEALEVFEVFASGTLKEEVYILDDVAGKRIAIAPAELKQRYRRPAPEEAAAGGAAPPGRGEGCS